MVTVQPNLDELRSKSDEAAPKRSGDGVSFSRRGEMEAHARWAPPAAGRREILALARAGAIRSCRNEREMSLLQEMAEKTRVHFRILRANFSHQA